MNNTTSPALTPAEQVIQYLRKEFLNDHSRIASRSSCELLNRVSDYAFGASMAIGVLTDNSDLDVFKFGMNCSSMSEALYGGLES